MSVATKQTHTPGPWEITGDDKDKVDIENRNLGIVVAHCYRTNTREESGNAEANARLIAAAPEMLEALEQARHAITVFYDSSEDNVSNPVMRKVGYALEAVQAAIRKAKGEL